MNLLSLAELYGFYFAAAFLIATFVVAVAIHRGYEPLALDGRPILSPLDEHAHERLSAGEASAAYLYAEREAMELDYALSLPARNHR